MAYKGEERVGRGLLGDAGAGDAPLPIAAPPSARASSGSAARPWFNLATILLTFPILNFRAAH